MSYSNTHNYFQPLSLKQRRDLYDWIIREAIINDKIVSNSRVTQLDGAVELISSLSGVRGPDMILREILQVQFRQLLESVKERAHALRYEMRKKLVPGVTMAQALYGDLITQPDFELVDDPTADSDFEDLQLRPGLAQTVVSFPEPNPEQLQVFFYALGTPGWILFDDPPHGRHWWLKPDVFYNHWTSPQRWKILIEDLKMFSTPGPDPGVALVSGIVLVHPVQLLQLYISCVNHIQKVFNHWDLAHQKTARLVHVTTQPVFNFHKAIYLAYITHPCFSPIVRIPEHFRLFVGLDQMGQMNRPQLFEIFQWMGKDMIPVNGTNLKLWSDWQSLHEFGNEAYSRHLHSLAKLESDLEKIPATEGRCSIEQAIIAIRLEVDDFQARHRNKYSLDCALFLVYRSYYEGRFATPPNGERLPLKTPPSLRNAEKRI
ncbi:hypothetical protein T439DRAFT_356522 [Meredithblackwellia eburnea MCA 4105]